MATGNSRLEPSLPAGCGLGPGWSAFSLGWRGGVRRDLGGQVWGLVCPLFSSRPPTARVWCFQGSYGVQVGYKLGTAARDPKDTMGGRRDGIQRLLWVPELKLHIVSQSPKARSVLSYGRVCCSVSKGSRHRRPRASRGSEAEAVGPVAVSWELGRHLSCRGSEEPRCWANTDLL